MPKIVFVHISMVVDSLIAAFLQARQVLALLRDLQFLTTGPTVLDWETPIRFDTAPYTAEATLTACMVSRPRLPLHCEIVLCIDASPLISSCVELAMKDWAGKADYFTMVQSAMISMMIQQSLIYTIQLLHIALNIPSSERFSKADQLF